MPKWTKSYTFFGLLRASESAHLLVTLTYIQYVASMRRETGILAMHDKYIDTARTLRDAAALVKFINHF